MMSIKPNRLSLAILTLSLIMLVVALSCSPNPSTDLYWQLRAGKDILATKSPPHFDPYSWTRHGSPWVAHEWLTFVVFWIVYKAGSGFVGLLVFKTVLLAVTITLFHLYVARASNYRLLPAYLFTLCAAYPLSVGFQARPQIFTYLFTTITAMAALKYRDDHRKLWKLWGLVPIFILWTNLHSGVYVGVFLLGAWAVGDLIDGFLGRQTDRSMDTRKQGIQLLSITAACFAATFINPYGILELTNFVSTILNQNAMNSVSEWASPTLHGAAGIDFAAIAGLCILGIIYADKQVKTADYIVVGVLFHFALYSIRNIPVFALGGVMTAAPYFFSCLNKVLPISDSIDGDGSRKNSVFGQNPNSRYVLMFSMGFLCIGFLATSVNLMLNLDWVSGRGQSFSNRLAASNVELSANPKQAASALNANLVPTTWKMYNNYGMGGYLIWALPNYPVSIDGRADVYFGDVLDDYLTLDQLPYNWRQLLAKRMPDFVLTTPNEQQSRLFMSSPDWALIYVDSADLDNPVWTIGGYNAMIFVRRSAISKDTLEVMRRRCPAVLSPNFKTTYHWYPAVQ